MFHVKDFEKILNNYLNILQVKEKDAKALKKILHFKFLIWKTLSFQRGWWFIKSPNNWIWRYMGYTFSDFVMNAERRIPLNTKILNKFAKNHEDLLQIYNYLIVSLKLDFEDYVKKALEPETNSFHFQNLYDLQIYRVLQNIDNKKSKKRLPYKIFKISIFKIVERLRNFYFRFKIICEKKIVTYTKENFINFINKERVKDKYFPFGKESSYDPNHPNDKEYQNFSRLLDIIFNPYYLWQVHNTKIMTICYCSDYQKYYKKKIKSLKLQGKSIETLQKRYNQMLINKTNVCTDICNKSKDKNQENQEFIDNLFK